MCSRFSIERWRDRPRGPGWFADRTSLRLPPVTVDAPISGVIGDDADRPDSGTIWSRKAPASSATHLSDPEGLPHGRDDHNKPPRPAPRDTTVKNDRAPSRRYQDIHPASARADSDSGIPSRRLVETVRAPSSEAPVSEIRYGVIEGLPDFRPGPRMVSGFGIPRADGAPGYRAPVPRPEQASAARWARPSPGCIRLSTAPDLGMPEDRRHRHEAIRVRGAMYPSGSLHLRTNRLENRPSVVADPGRSVEALADPQSQVARTEASERTTAHPFARTLWPNPADTVRRRGERRGGLQV